MFLHSDRDHNNEFIQVSDLTRWKSTSRAVVDRDDIDEELQMFGNSLRQQLDMPIAEYCEDDSKFYRFVMPQHRNKGVQDREYQ